jgi:hypothetical protein
LTAPSLTLLCAFAPCNTLAPTRILVTSRSATLAVPANYGARPRRDHFLFDPCTLVLPYSRPIDHVRSHSIATSAPTIQDITNSFLAHAVWDLAVTPLHPANAPTPSYMSDLRERLARLGLSQYHEVFTAEGFDTWETVLDITESDLCAHELSLPASTCADRCAEVTSTSSLVIVGYVTILPFVHHQQLNSS